MTTATTPAPELPATVAYSDLRAALMTIGIDLEQPHLVVKVTMQPPGSIQVERLRLDADGQPIVVEGDFATAVETIGVEYPR